MTRRAHDDGERGAVELDLERLLAGDRVAAARRTPSREAVQ